jgi:predicted nucleotidyltransferase
MKLSEEKQTLLAEITDELKVIDGVKAIVLGGSYAVGLATESSDLDIGIYYYEQTPFDILKVKIVAERFSDNEQPTVTGFYEWGPWVNGGAWIKSEKSGSRFFIQKH